MQNLTDLIRTLSPKEQEAVTQFIDYLRRQPAGGPQATISQAADEFMREHPELLRLLAR
jgi:hypothetical protein